MATTIKAEVAFQLQPPKSVISFAFARPQIFLPLSGGRRNIHASRLEGFPVIGIPGIVSNLWTYGLHGGQLQPLVDGVKDKFQPVGYPNLVVH